MNSYELGADGENIAYKMLKMAGIDIFILDAVSTDLKYSFEIKNKEKFNAPPFDAQGLPYFQVKTRLYLYKKKGIRPVFIVRDPNDKIIYWQFLDILDNGIKEYLPKSKVVLYPLCAFNTINALEELKYYLD